MFVVTYNNFGYEGTFTLPKFVVETELEAYEAVRLLNEQWSKENLNLLVEYLTENYQVFKDWNKNRFRIVYDIGDNKTNEIIAESCKALGLRDPFPFSESIKWGAVWNEENGIGYDFEEVEKW